MVGFILKLSVQVMELPRISYALKRLRFLGLSAGASLLLWLMPPLKKMYLPSWMCTAIDCCARNKQRNMNDCSNLETGLLIFTAGCNQTAFATVNLKSIKLDWATSGRIVFAAWIWGESTSSVRLQQPAVCYPLFILPQFFSAVAAMPLT